MRTEHEFERHFFGDRVEICPHYAEVVTLDRQVRQVLVPRGATRIPVFEPDLLVQQPHVVTPEEPGGDIRDAGVSQECAVSFKTIRVRLILIERPRSSQQHGASARTWVMISPLECFLSEFERVVIERVFDEDNTVTTKLTLEFVYTVLEREEWKGLLLRCRRARRRSSPGILVGNLFRLFFV
jgi:hypothetical protein